MRFQGHGLRSFDAQAYDIQIRTWLRYEPPVPMTRYAGEFQIDPRVQPDIAHTTPDRHIRVPSGRIVTNEIRDVCLQPVERFQAGMGVGADETQLEVAA